MVNEHQLPPAPQMRAIITWYERMQEMRSRFACVPLMVALGTHTPAGGLKELLAR